METFTFASAVHGYIVFIKTYGSHLSEKNAMKPSAICLVSFPEWHGILNIACSGEISVEVIGHKQHCKQLCGGMEIPCQLEFNCANKVQMKRLKELLVSKIRV